jgi:hypothetical protein
MYIPHTQPGKSRSTATSQSFDTEPLVCFDTDCSFPFGPACQSCKFAIHTHEMKRTKIPSSERKIEWAGGLSTKKSPNYEGQLFAGGANELGEGKQCQDESHETFSKVPEPTTNQMVCQDTVTSPSMLQNAMLMALNPHKAKRKKHVTSLP